MKVDIGLFGTEDDWDAAVNAEQYGYDAVWASELTHDPFLPLAVAATRTERVSLGTNIAVAFARNPMSLAVVANDLQLYSKGRFLLGLGSQIKSHITRRFSMAWSSPADRMREYLLAVRSIWHTWASGEPLDFVGEFYTHTLMTPMFDPGPNPFGNPPIYLAGVGTRMTQVAGEVADGVFLHSFTTGRYIREVTLPALLKGRAAAGKVDLDGFSISGSPFIVTGPDPASMRDAATAVRKQIAFYASTPAYRPVLELHGWGDMQTELNLLSKQGKWDEMGRRITDDVLHEFAVVAPPDRVAEQLLAKYGDILTRTGLFALHRVPLDFWAPIMRELQAA